ncbi:MAG: hypothetical protein NZ742_04345 [Acidobacteria bacterium]|nr:hypothetical protein [Acidobacteriota bacterium]
MGFGVLGYRISEAGERRGPLEAAGTDWDGHKTQALAHADAIQPGDKVQILFLH